MSHGPQIAAPRLVEAELIARRMSSGRNQPLLVHARGQDNQLVQCVLKPRCRLALPPTEYLLEWIGSALARSFDISTPGPLAVRISAEFAAGITRDFLADLAGSIGLVFGSTFVGKPYTQMPADFVLNARQRRAATAILAFDIFIHNPDRRVGNHNLFVKRNDFLVFDHEAAFSFLLPLIGVSEDPTLSPGLDIARNHVFWRVLRGKEIDLDGFRQKLESMDKRFFDGLLQVTPQEWTVDLAAGKLERIVEVLLKRRDAVHQWLPQVRACLER
jgi:hypothetical protein